MSSQILVKAILENATGFAMIATDTEGSLLQWNASAEHLFGTGPEMQGANRAVFFTDQDRASGIPAQELARALATGRTEDSRLQQRADRSVFWAESVVTPIFNHAGQHEGFLQIYRDVTNRRLFEENILHAANTDALTGLANRAAFYERLYEGTLAGARTGHPLVVYLIDLDQFKEVNDTHGHQAGDLLLFQVASRLRALTRETDFIARLGGDEFGILQAGATSAIDGSKLAEKVLTAVGKSFDLNGIEAIITPSIGIAMAPHDTWIPDELIRRADAALYRVKRTGRNGFGYFTEELDREAHDRTRDLNAIRHAVRKKNFHLVYQPKMSKDGRTLKGMEALLRCDHVGLRDRPVIEVIALANQCGLMPEMSGWILDETCKQTKSWFAGDPRRFRVCVNLCAREVSDPDTPQMLDAVTRKYALDPAVFIVEITEQEIFQSGANGIAVLQTIRDLGFSIAIDDFGTGYSSINYLTQLPIDFVKLDMSFAQGIPHNAKSCIAVKGIVSLASALGLQVVAEGIERAEQHEFFQDTGCEALQGYYFSRPMTADHMSVWMQNRHS